MVKICVNRVGQKFGRLTFVEQQGKRCIALCDCGRTVSTTTYNITSGRTTSCGCFFKEMITKTNTTHGQTKTPTWNSWSSMKRRCNNNSRHNSYCYKGKGITYDPKWETFEGFYEDMGERPAGTTLDRRENNKGYYKENCRWATSREQWLNRNDPRVAVHLEKLKCEISSCMPDQETTNSSVVQL